MNVVVTDLATGRTTTGPIGDVHNTITAWYDTVDDLLDVDALALAIEAADPTWPALAARLGLGVTGGAMHTTTTGETP